MRDASRNLLLGDTGTVRLRDIQDGDFRSHEGQGHNKDAATMSHNKTCEDYARVKIGRGTTYPNGRTRHFVEHDGRTVFETDSEYDAAMFAEELYLKVTRRPHNSGEGR